MIGQDGDLRNLDSFVRQMGRVIVREGNVGQVHSFAHDISVLSTKLEGDDQGSRRASHR